MFSKNLQRFSIRKLSIGVASVLIGSSLMIINDNNYAKAATNNDRSTQSLNRRITEDQVQNSLNNAKAKQAAEAQKQSQAHTTLTQSQEKLNNLQVQNKAVQTQLNSELAKTPQLEQNVKDKSDQLAQINQKVQETQVATATAQKADETAQKQTNIDPKYQQAVNNAQTEKANSDAKVTNANKALDQNTYDYKAVMDKVAEAQRTINHAKEQTDSLHQQVTEANKTQQKAQAAADKAYQEYQDANAKYHEANKAYTEKTQALDDANIRLHVANTEKNDQTKKLNELQQDLTDYQTELATSKTAYNTAIKNLTAVNNKLGELTNKQTDLSKELASAQAAYDEANKQFGQVSAAANNLIILPQVYKDNVAKMYQILQKDTTENLSIYTGQSAVEKLDSEYIRLRREASDAAWASNYYTSNPADKDVMIDLDNMTDAQKLEMNIYAISIINNLRKQLGTKQLTLNTDAMKVANEISSEYNKDGRSNGDDKSHDARAINTVSENWGIEHTNDMRTGKNTPSDSTPSQHLENLYSFYTHATMTNENTTTAQSRGHWTIKYSQTPHVISLDDLHHNIYNDIKGFIANPEEWLHMSSITNTLRDEQRLDHIPTNKISHATTIFANAPQYFGFSLSMLPNDNNISTHFIIIEDDYIQTNSRFNKNANVTIPDASQAKETMNTVSNKLKNVNNTVAQANDELNGLVNNKNIYTRQMNQGQLNVEQAQNQVDQTVNSIKNAQESLDNANKDIKTYSVLQANLNDQLSSLLDALTMARVDNNAKQQANAIAQDNLAKAKKNLTDKLALEKEGTERVNKAQLALPVFTEKANKLKAQRVQLEQNLTDTKHENQKLQVKLDQAKEALTSYMSAKKLDLNKASQAHQAYLDTKDTLDKLTKEQSNAEQALDDAKKALKDNQDKINRLHLAIEFNNAQMKDLEKQIADAQIVIKNSNLDELNKEVANAEQALADAKKKNSDAISINGKHASISTIDSNKTTVKPVANPSVKAPTDTKELLNQAKEKLNEPTLTESQHESLKKSLNKLETKVNNDSNSIKADNQLPVEQSVTKVNNEESDPMINSKSVMASTKHNVPSVTNSTYEAKLPQTSDNKVEAAVLTGFGVVISMFGLVGTRRKKN